jgi:hypothetical protein
VRLTVPTEPNTSHQYGDPVAVGTDAPASLRLGWASAWCAAPIDIARLRLTLPRDAGVLTFAGFGASACFGTPGDGSKAPIRVGSFSPKEYLPARISTSFDGLSARAILPESVLRGSRLHFLVVLTAPVGHDVSLDPCPDYLVAIGDVTDSTHATYALNCAAVPYRDAGGHPYLPAGTDVRFDMEADAPSRPTDGAKLVWQLDGIDTVAGGTIRIRG